MNMFPTLIDLKVGKILKIYLFVTHILFLKQKTKKSCKTEKNERSKKERKQIKLKPPPAYTTRKKMQMSAIII